MKFFLENVSVIYAVLATLFAVAYIIWGYKTSKYEGSQFDVPVVNTFENFYTSEYAEQYAEIDVKIKELKIQIEDYKDRHDIAFNKNDQLTCTEIFDCIISVRDEIENLYEKQYELKALYHNRQSQEV